MILRYGSYVLPSLLVHGAFFAALASTPVSEVPRAMIDAVEFIAITDDGGGRVGNDTQIGDADEPKAVVEKKFRQVKPRPKPSAPKPAIAVKPTSTPEPANEGDGELDLTNAEGDGAPEPSHSLVMGSAGTNPNATRAGSGTGQEGVDRRSALRAWLREIQREVNKIATRNYPASAVRMKLEGKLRLGITIGDDGSILGVRVLTSSGHGVLDESATESVMALHIPAPPDELGWREREISLPIRYALQ